MTVGDGCESVTFYLVPYFGGLNFGTFSPAKHLEGENLLLKINAMRCW